jgi:sialidase-1
LLPPATHRRVAPILLFCLGIGLALASNASPPVKPPAANDYFVLRGGLANCRLKFIREKHGRVAFLGGSITHMAGWRDLVGRELERRFPGTVFDFINAGIPSLGSVPGAFRFSRDVLAGGPVDLLFEEAAVNDEINGTSDTDQIRAMEGIVRHAWAANPDTDVVLLYLADPDKIRLIRQGGRPGVIANHEQVAAHYGLPSIDLAREVATRIAAGEFSWEKDFKGLHPAPFGHEVYARSVARLLDAAWASPLGTTDSIQPHAMPAPLDPANYAQGCLVDVHGATPDAHWRLVEKWRPSDGAAARPGFVDVPALVADQPGATLRFKFKGTAVGIFVASGPDAGIVEWQVDGGTPATLNLFTRWSPTLHLPWAQVLAESLADAEHELTLRVSAEHDPRSKGQAVRIIHFLVNGG